MTFVQESCTVLKGEQRSARSISDWNFPPFLPNLLFMNRFRPMFVVITRGTQKCQNETWITIPVWLTLCFLTRGKPSGHTMNLWIGLANLDSNWKYSIQIHLNLIPWINFHWLFIGISRNIDKIKLLMLKKV